MAESDDLRRIDELLEAALDRPPEDRARHLLEVCGGDSGLRERLQRLIALAECAEDALPPGGALAGPLWDELSREVRGADREWQPGERVGRYQVRKLLGAGGMGLVYQAYDASLGRDVAIKALADGVAEAPDGRRRLEREARLLATLNHPNIGAIYGLELIEDAPYLVLELVEGPTLAERLERGALPIDEAVQVGLQVALALEEAHRKGVVHRDLKPANVKLGAGGRVKVLDFGIAKPIARAVDPTSGTAGTVTRSGTVLGTAPYMSPEQARGEPADTRSDVWAFGCLLYEMLAGQPAFRGASPAEILAAVLRDDVDWGLLPRGTPAAVRRLLRRCLRRDVRDRLQDIGDARLDLNEPAEDSGAEERGHRARPVFWLSAVALLAGLMGAWIASGRGPHPRGVARLSLELPAGLALGSDFSAPFALSPGGSRLAMVASKDGTTRLYLRKLDRLELVPLPGTEGAWQPFFSPDGRELAFFAERKLKKVPVDGGAVVSLAEIGGNPRGGTWAADGTIVLATSPRSGLARVDARRGGTPTPFTHLDLGRGEGSHRWPQAVPGRPWIVFTTGIHNATFDDARLEAVSLETGERRELLGSGSHGRCAAGRLFFALSGRLLAAPFDAETMAVRGTPEVVLDGVRYDMRTGGTHAAVSDGGTLVYSAAAPTSLETHLAWVDGAGSLTRIGGSPRQFREPCLSPEGLRVAVRIGTESQSDLWVVHTESATLSRLPFNLSPHRPIWTPDGRAVTVSAEKDGRWKLFTVPVTGSGGAVVLFEGSHRVYPNAWSADGRSLVFQEQRPTTGWDLRVLPVGPDGRAAGAVRDLAATSFQEVNAAVSADGGWVAYESDELDGIYGIYVLPLTGPGAKVRATVTGARWPRWGADGQLYYWHPPGARSGPSRTLPGLHRIAWRRAAQLATASSTPVWGGAAPASLGRLVVGSYAGYSVDVSRPGPRFLFLETGAASIEAPVRGPVLVLNWPEELAHPRVGR